MPNINTAKIKMHETAIFPFAVYEYDVFGMSL
jgi:hypothetical protein